MTGKVEKILDIVTFGLYNIRINKNNYGRKFMADATAKNYTDEMVEHMVAAYEDMPTLATVEDLVIEFGKPKRSIISKLSSLGVYKAQKRTGTTKTGEAAITKAMLADSIQAKLGTNQLATLVKMSKADLMTLASLVDAAEYHG